MSSGSVGVRRSILDLGPRLRAGFALAYVTLMLVVVVTGQQRPDHAFGFQMFNESSNMNIHLYRRVRGSHRLEPLRDGVLRERTRHGVEVVRWGDRVRDPVLGVLERPVHAKYGLAGQLYRLEFALDEFASRVPRGGTTTGIVAIVLAEHNGRPPHEVRLEAVLR